MYARKRLWVGGDTARGRGRGRGRRGTRSRSKAIHPLGGSSDHPECWGIHGRRGRQWCRSRSQSRSRGWDRSRSGRQARNVGLGQGKGSGRVLARDSQPWGLRGATTAGTTTTRSGRGGSIRGHVATRTALHAMARVARGARNVVFLQDGLHGGWLRRGPGHELANHLCAKRCDNKPRRCVCGGGGGRCKGDKARETGEQATRLVAHDNGQQAEAGAR